jgi:hypothetical protein
MEHNKSLVSLLYDIPDFGKRFSKKVAEVKKDKETLVSNAKEYNKKFEQEIQDGTKKRQLLLVEGQSKGLKEEEINWGEKFLPTVRTPILNFLYFLLKEESTEADYQINNLKLEYDKKNKKLEEESYKTDIDPEFLYTLLRESRLSTEEFGKVSDILNEKHGSLQDEFTIENTDFKQPDDMDSLMFEQMGHELFKRLKKLKALSYSSNEHEASLAHSKFAKLCKEYKINPDKVPYIGNETFD